MADSGDIVTALAVLRRDALHALLAGEPTDAANANLRLRAALRCADARFAAALPTGEQATGDCADA